jgi:hypothetical protein
VIESGSAYWRVLQPGEEKGRRVAGDEVMISSPNNKLLTKKKYKREFETSKRKFDEILKQNE